MRDTIADRAWITGLTACFLGIGVARAASDAGSISSGADSLPATSMPTTQEDVAPPANLMSLFDKAGMGTTMDNLGLDVYGHVEGGYTYQFLQPNNTINGRTYDFTSNRALLNQAAINIERSVTVATDHFDIGFRVEAQEGTDAYVFESIQSHQKYVLPGAPGILQGTNSDNLFDVGGNNSRYQFDLPNAYVDFSIPLGRGLRVRAGRFEFFKPLDPNDRLFYSTTFVYTNALPFTNTGVTVAYNFTDGTGVELGLSRGWNVTVNDNNGSIDFLGKAHIKLNDTTRLVAATSIGPEVTGNSHDYITLVDVSVRHAITDSISVMADGLYAHQFGNSTTSYGYNPVPPTFVAAPTTAVLPVSLPASYYGVSGDAAWQVNPYYALGGRLEWFRDDGGILSGNSRTLFEATIGTTVTPFPKDGIGQNFKFRPEVRWDYANRDFFGLNSMGVPTRKNQLTFAMDVIYNF